MPTKSNKEERLQKIIARAGLASRRAAEQMIVEGRVQVDGRVVKELGAKADPNDSEIRVDGTRIRLERRRRYIILNKPSGYVTTRSDPGGRPTVMELLPHSLRSLYPIGRLDMSSTGLLLLTDDGDFAQQVGHPKFGIEKTYVVTVRGTPSDRTLERARNGIRVEGDLLKVKSVHLLGSRRQSKRTLRQPSPMPRRKPGSSVAYWRTGPQRERDKVETARLDVVLVEGKYREVRRLFKALGHPVLALHRSKVGELSDRGLPEGMFRPLSALEIRQLKSPRDAPAEARARRSPAFAKASASVKTSADRSARPRRSSKSEGGRSEERTDRRRPQSERLSSNTPRDRRNASYRGESASDARVRRKPAFGKASASAETSTDKSARSRRSAMGVGGKKERPSRDARRKRGDRVPPSPRASSSAETSMDKPSRPHRRPKDGGDKKKRPWRDGRREHSDRVSPSPRASASFEAPADKPARPRRPSSNKQRRVSPKRLAKSTPQSKGGNARQKGKGDRGAVPKISKKPSRRVKKGA